MADLLSSLQHIYQSWDRKCHQGKRPAMSEDKKMSTLGLRAYSAAKRTAQKQFEESNNTKVNRSTEMCSRRASKCNAPVSVQGKPALQSQISASGHLQVQESEACRPFVLQSLHTIEQGTRRRYAHIKA
jgi:hypothetical protein